jgi:putative tryptophan/tyrosine transport system substrate-binding protein
MRRREFISLVGGAAATGTLPLAARAQQPERMRRVGMLVGVPEDDPEMKARLVAFRQGLEKLGWSESRNLRIDIRYASAQTTEQNQMLAKELVALQPDVIVGLGPPVVSTLSREGPNIPIVFTGVPDAIGAGFVKSLARPGGNITGLINYEETITGKWLALLKEIAPRLSRAGVVGNPQTTAFDYFLRSAQAAAPSLSVEILPNRVGNAADIERAIELFARVPNTGMVVMPDSTTIALRDLVISLAAKHRVPAVYPARFWVAAGGLMSYGIDFVEVFRQAASYVDRILRGAKPTDIPVQAPTKFETAINLKTAKALGLVVSPTLLVRADQVIE